MSADGGRVIENAATGERIVVRGADGVAPGEVLAFDLYLRPGGHVPAGHVHPGQSERFSVVSGALLVRIGGRAARLGPGEAAEIPPRTAHWFGNAAAGETHVRVEVRPALRLEELFAEASEIERVHTGALARLSDLAAMLLAHRREVAMPGVPDFVAKAGLTALAALGRSRRARRARSAAVPTSLGARS